MSEFLGYAAYMAWWLRWFMLAYSTIMLTLAAIVGGQSAALGALAGSLLGCLVVTAIASYVGWTAR